MTFALNVLVSALVISFASWLSGRAPALAGFFVALPLASMVVVPMSYVEHGDAEATVLLARSIFVAIPVSLCFFLPFLLAGRMGLGFWGLYALGLAALPAGFLVHRAVVRWWFGA